ncbi:MAG TPA: hypothetical protein VF901_30220 [Bradyrhizobium sp.]
MSLTIGIAALLIAIVLLIVGHFFPFGVPLTFVGVGLIASLIYDRRYKPASKQPIGPGWVDTGERFIDPDTNKRVAVFMRPETGERDYREL